MANQDESQGEPREDGTDAVITRQVVEENEAALLALARRMLRRPEDAEDAVQEAWISALKSAPTFERRANLRTWLTAILRRRIFDHYHGERTFDAGVDELAVFTAPEHYDLHEAATRAVGELSKLQELERTAITLCDLDDCDRGEAAARMHVTRGHLRVLLHRGRSKLHEYLRAQDVGAEILC